MGSPTRINYMIPGVPKKNAGQNMAIVGEPCNVDAHANIPALFITEL